jgi:hypothetical protein
MGDALDEIFEQTSLRANEGTRRGGKGFRFKLIAQSRAHRRSARKEEGVRAGAFRWEARGAIDPIETQQPAPAG